MMNSNIFLPGFEEVIIKKTEIVEDKYSFYVEMPVKEHSCVDCGALTSKIHDYRTQKIKHLKLFERQTLIFYRNAVLRVSVGKDLPKRILLLSGINVYLLSLTKR